MTTRLRAVVAYLTAALTCLAVLLSVGLAYRSVGEDDRIAAAVAANSADLEREIRSDCPFKRQIAELPAINIAEGRPVTEALAELASAARDAYIGKRCEKAGYGPPPRVYVADPMPTPRR